MGDDLEIIYGRCNGKITKKRRVCDLMTHYIADDIVQSNPPKMGRNSCPRDDNDLGRSSD